VRFSTWAPLLLPREYRIVCTDADRLPGRRENLSGKYAGQLRAAGPCFRRDGDLVNRVTWSNAISGTRVSAIEQVTLAGWADEFAPAEQLTENSKKRIPERAIHPLRLRPPLSAPQRWLGVQDSDSRRSNNSWSVAGDMGNSRTPRNASSPILSWPKKR